MVLLDTHVLLWWAFNPELLSRPALDRLQAEETTGQVLYSSISLWEIGVKLRNGKLRLPLTVDRFAKHLQASGFVRSVDITDEIWLENLRLDWNHKDPADRTIVATSRMLALSLITRDEEIQKFPGVHWLW